MGVILYSTNCPKCKILEKKLSSAKIPYETVSDVDMMMKKGFLSAPKLEVDGEVYDFAEAVNWANKKMGE